MRRGSKSPFTPRKGALSRSERRLSRSRITKRMRLNLPGRPIQAQQALEVIIAANVVSADRAKIVLARSVGVATESEGDPILMLREKFLHCAITAEGDPQQPIQIDR